MYKIRSSPFFFVFLTINISKTARKNLQSHPSANLARQRGVGSHDHSRGRLSILVGLPLAHTQDRQQTNSPSPPLTTSTYGTEINGYGCGYADLASGVLLGWEGGRELIRGIW
jgi:hypothetical protein